MSTPTEAVLALLRRLPSEAPADVVAAILTTERPWAPPVTPRAAARLLGRLVQSGVVVRRTRGDGLVVFRALRG